MSNVSPAEPWRARTLAAALAGIVILLCLHTRGQLLRPGWMVGLVWLLPAFACVAWWSRRETGGTAVEHFERRWAPGLALACVLVVYLYASPVLYRWFYFSQWVPEADWASRLFLSPAAQVPLIAACLTPLILWRRRGSVGWVGAVALIGMVLCLKSFWVATGGLPLYRDDHPSFMFRLWLFAENFPRLSYYNPYWAAGESGLYTLASGTQGLGTLFWPVWRIAEIAQVYTPLLGLFFIVVVPLLAAWSMRLIGGGPTSACVAACVALGISPYFFLWLLHFGTVGSSFACPFIMPVCAALYRALWLEGRRAATAATLVISSVFLLVWPVSAFVVPVLLLGVLFSARNWTRARIRFLVGCAVAIAAFVLPVVISILLHTDVGGFAEIASRPMGWLAGWQTGWRRITSHGWQMHPLVLFFGVGGLWFLRDRGLRAFFGPVLIGLALLAGWGENWKPQYQLARVGICLGFAAALPAGLWIGRLLDERARWMAPARGLLVALLFFGVANTATIYAHEGRVRFRTISAETVAFTEWLKDHTDPHARILFAGPTTHGFGAGHIAYLPLMADREMLACDYYHFSPQRVEYQYPPTAFHTSEEAVFGFMEMYNVGHIVTFHQKWREYLLSRPGEYKEVHIFGERLKKYVFRVKRAPDYFEEGSGTVRASLNRLDVELDDPSAPAVLRYTWNDGLKAVPPVVIEPQEMGHGIRFIKVHPNGRRAFSIRYARWL